MAEIVKKAVLGVSPGMAFRKFVDELSVWWPKEYTWSRDQLVDIRIDGKRDGLCTEIGPYGFRCDWGRVTAWAENSRIGLKWQIGPNREPVPDPALSSDLVLDFLPEGTSSALVLKHFNFENHGEGSEKYRKMMDSEYGWDYILDRFKDYCNGGTASL